MFDSHGDLNAGGLWFYTIALALGFGFWTENLFLIWTGIIGVAITLLLLPFYLLGLLILWFEDDL